MRHRANVSVVFAVVADSAALFAGIVMVLALPVAVFEVVGYAAGGSWNPIASYERARPAMQPILGVAGCITAMWVVAGLSQLVAFLVQEFFGMPAVIRWLTAYREAIAEARARSGEFANAFDSALHPKGRERAQALAAIATAQAESGAIVAARATFAAAVQTASGIRGDKDRVEALAAVAAAQERAGEHEASKATLAAMHVAVRRSPGVILTTSGQVRSAARSGSSERRECSAQERAGVAGAKRPCYSDSDDKYRSGHSDHSTRASSHGRE